MFVKKKSSYTETESLFRDAPMARATDPETSRIAANEQIVSGRRERHAAIILEWVKRWPGSTAVELVASAMLDHKGISRHEVSRRLPELESAGLVRRGDSRNCSFSGTKQLTWFPVEVSNG